MTDSDLLAPLLLEFGNAVFDCGMFDGDGGEESRQQYETLLALDHRARAKVVEWAERQAARIRELEDALRPFAQHDWSFSSAPDEAPIQVPGLAIEDLTLGDLKRAAAALRGKREDHE